jgi:hypothetical protein
MPRGAAAQEWEQVVQFEGWERKNFIGGIHRVSSCRIPHYKLKSSVLYNSFLDSCTIYDSVKYFISKRTK